ncbi:cytochrome c oxidase subunit 3 [Microvirga sp. M2]|uniref:cytochrome c oxidase subunit 3 n=1 Tax=Microvirga sp. M2 TaxID=3073270 RepID=UPI0039C3B150
MSDISMTRAPPSGAAVRPPPLPVGSIGRKASGWWGMLTIILTEGSLFSYLLFSYYYFAVQYGREWLPGDPPKFRLSLPNTIILIVSSLVVWWAERGAKRGSWGQLVLGLLGGFILGCVFVVIQLFEWKDKPFTYASSAYGSLYFTITGFHMAHVVAGLVILLMLLVWSLMRYFDSERNAPVSIGAIYWHFVDVVWLTVFFSLYITPYLG